MRGDCPHSWVADCVALENGTGWTGETHGPRRCWHGPTELPFSPPSRLIPPPADRREGGQRGARGDGLFSLHFFPVDFFSFCWLQIVLCKKGDPHAVHRARCIRGNLIKWQL